MNTLDTRGKSCPTPVLETKKALKSMNAGALLTVLASDAGSSRDIPALCRQTGHDLMKTGETDGTFSFVIQKN